MAFLVEGEVGDVVKVRRNYACTVWMANLSDVTSNMQQKFYLLVLR